MSTTIQIKRTTTNSSPSLSFGEFGLISSNTGSSLFIGDNTTNIIPINALKIYSSNAASFIIQQWNSFTIMNSSLLSIITLPITSSFNIGQVIHIKNVGSADLTINSTGGDLINGGSSIILLQNSSIKLISAGNNNIYSF